MNQKYSSREALLADCPSCRQPYLVLLKSASGKKGDDMLACKSCKLAIFAEELKKKLFTV
ncbi:MAG: hypothetical protein OER82_12045 [Nitrosopumilus sp.]|nr:hypothetical protein [Nitrosopumilus sp.]